MGTAGGVGPGVTFRRAYAARPIRVARLQAIRCLPFAGLRIRPRGRRWWVATAQMPARDIELGAVFVGENRRRGPGCRPSSSRRGTDLVRDLPGLRRRSVRSLASDCRHRRHLCSRRWPRSLRFLVDHDLRVATLRGGPVAGQPSSLSAPVPPVEPLPWGRPSPPGSSPAGFATPRYLGQLVATPVLADLASSASSRPRGEDLLLSGMRA